MKVFSTFSGIGGFEIGINKAAIKVLGEGIKHIELVGYSEIDKYATSVFENHFKGVKNYGDITKIDTKDLPEFDCLVGGFPCQAFSIAGKRKGFNDTRGTLFFDLARILQDKRPRLFVFENVKGLLNHDDGRTFKTIIRTIDELGYDCQWQVCNSKDFGVPQNRERIIIVGHLRGTTRPKVFPIRRSIKEDTRTVGEGLSNTLTGRNAGNSNWRGNVVKVGTLRTHKDGNGFREMKSGLSPTIPARARNDGSGQPVIETIRPVITPDRVNKRQNGRRFKNNGEPAFTVTAQDRHGILIGDSVIRRLTPKECERLQAFPDDWTKFGSNGQIISDTQRYKMCGNAVTTSVIQNIFERIFESEKQNYK